MIVIEVKFLAHISLYYFISRYTTIILVYHLGARYLSSVFIWKEVV